MEESMVLEEEEEEEGALNNTTDGNVCIFDGVAHWKAAVVR